MLSMLAGCELLAGQQSFFVGAATGTDDDPFAIELGEIVVLDRFGVAVSFEELLDSRCPRNVDCIWSGSVTASFVIRQGTHETLLMPSGYVGAAPRDGGLAAEAGEWRLELRSVSPYPTVDPTTGERADTGPPTANVMVVRR